MEVVFLDAYTVNPGDLSWDGLAAEGELEHYPYTRTEDIADRAQGKEVVITNKCKMTAQVIASLPDLKCICVAATGYDNVDIAAAKAHGVIVCNVAGYSTQSVVQHVFALLLSALNDGRRYSEGVKAGRWSASEHFAYTDHPIRSLESMTLGIVGFGTIGQALARVALAFGMTVVAHRRSKVPSPVDGVEMVGLSALIAQSDVVSMHVPATDATKGMVDRNFLQHMKDDAILINTARGTLIQEAELVNWLRHRPRAMALLDVMAQEPPPPDHPYFRLSNCILTPHQAWMSVAARQKLLDGLIENIKNYKSGTLKGLA